MKRKIIVVFTTLLILLALFSACGYSRKSKQMVYKVGEEYELGKTGIVHKVEHDSEREQFVYYFSASKSKLRPEADEGIFYFILFDDDDSQETYGTIPPAYSGLVITDESGAPVAFDEEGRYCFQGKIDKIFYISYKDADEQVKKAINDNRYTIEVAGKMFVPE